ncbi:MAG: hypothetical protein ABSC23_06060 [Bryobacteraceae bacterium]|jgi:hypothetical protein
MMARWAFLLAILGLWTGAGLGQNTVRSAVPAGGGAPPTAPGSSGAVIAARTTVGISPVVVWAPYACERTEENVQTLADGTHLTHSSPVQRMYRDSQGRTRTEREIIGGITLANGPKRPLVVEIGNPVAGVAYVLDTQGKIAHRVPLPHMPGQAAARPAPPVQATPQKASSTRVMANGIEIKRESLGSQVMEGLLAEGTRTTTTYPIGAMGNDRPVVSVDEMWRSPDLGLVVLSKMSNGRTGETTVRLTNINRSEQDIALFQPPADYTIVDEAGPTVTIRYAQ